MLGTRVNVIIFGLLIVLLIYSGEYESTKGKISINGKSLKLFSCMINSLINILLLSLFRELESGRV